MRSLTNLQIAIFEDENLKNSAYKIYMQIPTNCLTQSKINNTIDILFTKNNKMCGYVKMIRPTMFNKPHTIIKKSILDGNISSTDFKALIKNTCYDTIPYLLDTPAVSYYSNDICEFTNHIIEADVSTHTIEYIDKLELEKNFPNIKFNKFLKDQHLVNRKGEATAFGQEYGIVTQYIYCQDTNKFEYQFVILATYYPKILKMIDFSYSKTNSLQERIEQLSIPKQVNLSHLDTIHTLTKETRLKDILEQILKN